jgi:hypothetical protein
MLKCLPPTESFFHTISDTSVRINGLTYESAAVGITSCYLIVMVKSGPAWRKVAFMNFLRVNHFSIAELKSEFVISTGSETVVVFGPNRFFLSKILYRQVSLVYCASNDKFKEIVSVNKPATYPTIIKYLTIPLSQAFQMMFLSDCRSHDSADSHIFACQFDAQIRSSDYHFDLSAIRPQSEVFSLISTAAKLQLITSLFCDSRTDYPPVLALERMTALNRNLKYVHLTYSKEVGNLEKVAETNCSTR